MCLCSGLFLRWVWLWRKEWLTLLPVAGYQPWSGSADIRLSLPQHHVALWALQWEMAPLSGQPELRRHRRHTLHLILGPESSETEQLHPCREHICQSHSRKSRIATLSLELIGIISVGKLPPYTCYCLFKCVVPAGWTSPPLPPWGRGSCDHKGQRGEDHSGCGSFGETQVPQIGKRKIDRENRKMHLSCCWLVALSTRTAF